MRSIRKLNDSRNKKHNIVLLKRMISYVAVALLLTLPLLSSGCANTEVGEDDSPWFGRLSTIHYSFSIELADNQDIDEITLFLPFPRQDGKLDTCMLKGQRNWQKKSEKFGGPTTLVDFSSRNTKYGPMLKVKMTKAPSAEDSRYFAFEGEYQYNNLLPVGRPWIDHPFAPVVERGGRKYTWIFVDSPVERNMKILLTYDAWYTDGYIPLQYMGGSSKRWMVGSSFGEGWYGPSESHSFLIEGHGWIEVPLWTGYID